ncbi:ATP-binding protein [Streptomyces sp. NPDC020681]|uniref:ATP-binding protein n=1 Tax=Streptomyces sp. NPDC020681 TaxID=3365083 RepID=UPI0037B8A534
MPLSRPRVVQTAVPALASSASEVRRTVAAQLTHWQLTELLDNAVLATDELFANAVRHASSGPYDTVVVTLECFERELRVSVADSSPRLPRPRTADVAAESGRGLSIVAALVDGWGSAPPEPGTEGKKVWFTLAIKEAT